MDDLHSLHHDGVFLRREAIEAGYTDRDLARLRQEGALHRLRHGAYLDATRWRDADGSGRHVMLCRAISLSHGLTVAFSHTSAAVLHGLDVWGTSLAQAHVIKMGARTGRTGRDLKYHDWHGGAARLVDANGLTVVSAEQAVISACSMLSVESGVVLADAAYRSGSCTPESLHATCAEMRGWPGTARLQITMRLSEPGAESVGESRARVLFWRCHLPKPVLQYEVRDGRGHLVGIADFAWPALGILGEFDGRIKYGRLLKPSETAGDAVYREKVREDRMREVTGWQFFRLGWADLEQPRQVRDRFHELVRRSSPTAS